MRHQFKDKGITRIAHHSMTWIVLFLLLLLCCLGSSGASTSSSIVAEIETSSPSPSSPHHATIECEIAEDGIHINAMGQTCPPNNQERNIPAPKHPKRKKLEVVTFAAQEEVRSSALPLPPSALTRPSISNHKYQNLHQFFTATENIDLQFADRAEVHPIAHPSQDLLDTFHRLNAQRRLEAGLTPLAASTPQTTRIVGLTNPPMHCLGLTLHSVTHVGIQTFVNDDGQYPEVHLTLMETEFEATGPQFLVSLFHKIMLHDDNDAGGRQKAVETIGFTREFLTVYCSCYMISSSVSLSDVASFICRIILPHMSLQEYGPSLPTTTPTMQTVV